MSIVQAPRTIRLDAASHGQPMTTEEFDAVSDWDECYRYELVHGIIVVSQFASDCEADLNDELAYLLGANFNEIPPRGVGDTLPGRFIYLPDGSRRLAARVIWTDLGRTPDPKADVPSIVIDFVSRSTRGRSRDQVEKREEYLALGIKEYWIIDRFERRMLVCFADGTERTVIESYQTALLPGFELSVAQLIALSDQWPNLEE